MNKEITDQEFVLAIRRLIATLKEVGIPTTEQIHKICNLLQHEYRETKYE